MKKILKTIGLVIGAGIVWMIATSAVVNVYGDFLQTAPIGIGYWTCVVLPIIAVLAFLIWRVWRKPSVKAGQTK